MSKLNELKAIINSGKFPNKYREFGGANLIITKDKDRGFHEGDTIIYSEHAAALSWLVDQLHGIYNEEINYANKYRFYPTIGELIKESLTSQDQIIESMLFVVDEIEKLWGPK